MRFFHTVKKGVHRVWIDHPSFLAKVQGKTGAKLYGAASGADFGECPATGCRRACVWATGAGIWRLL